MDEKYFFEHRSSKPRRGKLNFISIDADLSNLTGFRSVYAYSESLVEKIKKDNSTRGILGEEVYSDTLFVDFDGDPEHADNFRYYLKDSRINFERYHSGGRSIHFHVKQVNLLGRHVPYSERTWVAENIIGADLSFYHQAGMFRLNNTYHESGRGQKKLLEAHPGAKLIIPYIEKPVPATAAAEVANGKPGPKLVQYYDNILWEECEPGGRRPHMFKIIATGVDIGKSMTDIWNDLLIWNKQHAHPPLDLYLMDSFFKKTYMSRLKHKS